MKSHGLKEIQLSSYQPYLRYYHYRREETDVFMFFNEHPIDSISTEVFVPHNKRGFIYNGFENTLTPADAVYGVETTLKLELSPYQSIVVIFSDVPEQYVEPGYPHKLSEKKVLPNDGWHISMASSTEYPEFNTCRDIQELDNMSAPNRYPVFSGTFLYKKVFTIDDEVQDAVLDLSDAFETAEVRINGKTAGVKICPPYRYNISGFLRQGDNELHVEVTNTLVREQRDKFSRCIPLEPSGLIGPVQIFYSADIGR